MSPGFWASGGCHYHRTGGRLQSTALVPAGASAELMYLLYPYLFAAAYGGSVARGVSFRHPLDSAVRGVRVERRPPLPRDRVRNAVKLALLPVWPTGRVRCQPRVMAGGRAWRFDLGSEGTVCPAALRSLFPFYERQRLAGQASGDPRRWRACCPDHLINITFNDREPGDAFYDSICRWGDGVRLSQRRPCSRGRQTDAGSLEQIASRLQFPCPTLLNVALGYHLALGSGARLGFYDRDLLAAIFQCPNPRSRVIVKIRRRQQAMQLRVLDVEGLPCARGILPGLQLTLPADPAASAFCLDAFNVLYLYAGLCGELGGALDLQCAREDCQASFALSAA